MMITILRPGQEPLEIGSILIDFEGTLAQDRRVHPKAKDKINLLSKRTKIYILIKGEKEGVEKVLKNVKAERVYVNEEKSSQQKLDLLRQIGPPGAVAIGNGVDDTSMIEEAGLSLCIIGKEGTFAETVKKADFIFLNIVDALDFLLKPQRQKATFGN